jgi:6-phosphogluconolactonase
MAEFRTYPDAASLARAAAEHLTNLATEAMTARGRFVVALSGGSTPRTTYTLLATERFTTRVDWSRVHIFWSDERCVPPDHPDSNYRMARETLLDKISIPAENVHRIRGELPHDEAAAAYQAELEAVLGVNGWFDLVLLGMGEDGHIASLFPGTTALEEHERPVVAVYMERLRAWRITLTLPLINAARHVLFLVSGAAKAPTLARIHAGERLPASLVQPVQGQLTWLVDMAAAGRLKGQI